MKNNTKEERDKARAAYIAQCEKTGFYSSPHATLAAHVCWKACVDGKNAGKFHVIIFGSAPKPLGNYIFRTQTDAELWITAALQGIRDKMERAEIEKAEKKQFDATQHWTVGDVVYNSWGYEQTNIDFYQVTRVSEKCVWIREIAQNSSDNGGPNGGTCFPRRNEFIGEEIRKAAKSRWPDSLSMTHGACSKWNGKPKHCSSYH
jgi:hypothetical protein